MEASSSSGGRGGRGSPGGRGGKGGGGKGGGKGVGKGGRGAPQGGRGAAGTGRGGGGSSSSGPKRDERKKAKTPSRKNQIRSLERLLKREGLEASMKTALTIKLKALAGEVGQVCLRCLWLSFKKNFQLS